MRTRWKSGGPKGRKLEERFWEKVEVRGQDECWLWIGSRKPSGYGQITIYALTGSKSPENAHRVSLFLSTGEWPTEYVMHICDNPPCVNPRHLREGTPRDNVEDMIRKGRGGNCISRETVMVLRSRLENGEQAKALAMEFKISESAVSRIKHRSRRVYC